MPAVDLTAAGDTAIGLGGWEKKNFKTVHAPVLRFIVYRPHTLNSIQLDGCIVLNEHIRRVFASKRSAICNRCFPGPTRVLDACDISIASAVFAGLTG